MKLLSVVLYHDTPYIVTQIGPTGLLKLKRADAKPEGGCWHRIVLARPRDVTPLRKEAGA